MRSALRLRRLVVQRDCCRPLSSKRHAASFTVKAEDYGSSPFFVENEPGPSRWRSVDRTVSQALNPVSSTFESSFFTSSSQNLSVSSTSRQLEVDYTASENELIERLEAHLFDPERTSSIPRSPLEFAQETWDLYTKLSKSTRRTLPARTLQKVLRAVAPSEYLVPIRRSSRYAVDVRESKKYEKRLRSIMKDLTTSEKAQPADFGVVMHRLAQRGDVLHVEAVHQELLAVFPDEGLRGSEGEGDARVMRRLTAIHKWLKSVATICRPNDTFRRLDGSHVFREEQDRIRTLMDKSEHVVMTLWSILRDYTERRTVTTPRAVALLTSNLNLSRMLFADKPYAGTMDTMLEELFKQCYGVNLPYLAIKEVGPKQKGIYVDPDREMVNALAEWYGRKGEIWKMVAAVQVFGGLGREEITMNEPMELNNEAHTSTAEAIPMTSEVVDMDWLGRPRKPPITQDAPETVITDTAVASTSTADASGRQDQNDGSSSRPRRFQHFCPAQTPVSTRVPSSFSEAPALDNDTSPRSSTLYTNLTFSLMMHHAVAAKDTIAAMYIFRVYMDTVAESQSDWVLLIARESTQWTQETEELLGKK